MAIYPFLGTGTAYGRSTVYGSVSAYAPVKGEDRLSRPFPYPTLEQWRRYALTAASTSTALTTQRRMAVLFAHEEEMQCVFNELTRTDPALLSGYYNDKQTAILADKALAIPYTLKTAAYLELKHQNIPDTYLHFIQQRVEGSSFAQRVAGVCAAVYLTAILLEELEAIS